MALSVFKEIRGWGHFSLLRHLFIMQRENFVATDLRLPYFKQQRGYREESKVNNRTTAKSERPQTRKLMTSSGDNEAMAFWIIV